MSEELRVLSIMGVIGVLFIIVAMLASHYYSVNPYNMSKKESQGIVDKIQYVRDSRTGLCYAVQYMRLTWVPCDKIPEFKTTEKTVKE